MYSYSMSTVTGRSMLSLFCLLISSKCNNLLLPFKGVEFFLDGVMTNGPVSVTAVGIFGTADDTPLICQSEVAGNAASQNWYLHPDQQSTAASDRIESNGDRGWRRTRETTTDGFSQVLLRRISASVTALEGVFTCEITGTGDSNPIRSLSVLYPSELPTNQTTRSTLVVYTPAECSGYTAHMRESGFLTFSVH